MKEPRQIAESIVGPIQWDSPIGGFCRCPGQAAHTAPSGPRDCRVRIDGAPTIFCFHTHCGEALEKANLELRRRLGGESWTLKLPDGRLVHSGQTGYTSDRAVGPPRQQNQQHEVPGRLRPGDITLLQDISTEITNRRQQILEDYYWPYDEIVAESPLAVASREPLDQFRLWLQLWPADATVWIGEVFHSGHEHAAHFRPVADWYNIGPAMGNFTCPSSFQPGAFARSENSIRRRHFLVVESDTLSRDEVGAVFLWLRRELMYDLKCIVDTGGKSLHGWFAPPGPYLEPRAKAALTAIGCDPKLFGASQPVRVPGAFRENKLQRLLWLSS